MNKIVYNFEEKKMPKGTRKVTNKDFIDICKFEKGELKAYLRKELKKYYKEVISKDGFLYARGNKIVVTAHMDTTPRLEYGKRKMVKDVFEYEEDGKHVVYSPQGIGGDDRCGIYMIMEILKRTILRPTIVFCEEEEIGCVGSEKFSESKYIDELKDKYFIIELDRRGSNDIVFYNDENEDFHNYVAEVTGYEENYGSCSDISNICPACGISGVNISCGYYNEHHKDEKVVLEEMERTLNTAIVLIKEGIETKTQYEYIERKYNFGRYSYSNWEYDQSYNYKRYNSYYNEWLKTYEKEEEKGKYCLYVEYDNGYGDEGDYACEADTVAEAWYNFFSNHPNLTMADVVDYEEWNENEYLTKVE